MSDTQALSTPALDSTGQNFTKTLHNTFNASTDPSQVRLPSPFVVCVLGASRGIGAAIAQAYARANATVLVLSARSVDQLESMAEDIAAINPAVKVRIAPCDTTSNESVSDLAETVTLEVGRLDVLVYNSGFAGPLITRVTDGDPLDLQRAFMVNSIGPALVAHHFIPLLLASPGGAKAFVAVSAMAAWITEGPIAAPGYCTSKLAQIRLMEHIAAEYRKDGLLAVAVHPGAVKTEMAKTAPAEFIPFLVDDVALCGAFCVWLTKANRERLWLSGRFLSATWDVEELTGMKDVIVQKDLLKARMVIS